jgi:hypothetical protein
VKPEQIRPNQCKACPWKTSTVPERDIPGGYCESLHADLRKTIAEPGRFSFGSGQRTVMACHESSPGREQVCTGWLMHQLGPGNNLGLRLQMMRPEIAERIKLVRLDGPQHERFEDTLPQHDEDEIYDETEESDIEQVTIRRKPARKPATKKKKSRKRA